MLTSCDQSPNITWATKEINTQFGYVIYRANGGQYFVDYSRVKKFYCPCDVSWWSAAVGEFVTSSGIRLLDQ